MVAEWVEVQLGRVSKLRGIGILPVIVYRLSGSLACASGLYGGRMGRGPIRPCVKTTWDRHPACHCVPVKWFTRLRFGLIWWPNGSRSN